MFRLHLGGMNFLKKVYTVSVYYEDHDYLMKNWDEEVKLINKWCHAVGLSYHGYSFDKPKNENECIVLTFSPEMFLKYPI